MTPRPSGPGPLKFTGRAVPAEAGRPERSRRGFVLACLALAALALLASVILYAARRVERPVVAAIAPLRGVSTASQPTASEPAPSAPPVQDHPPVAVVQAAAAPLPPAARVRPAEAALTPAQARFVAALSAAPGSLTLKVEDDPGAQASARLLSALFRRAGWSVQAVDTFGAGEPMAGFSAALGDTAQDDAVRQAFATAGIRLRPPAGEAGIVRTPELFVGPVAEAGEEPTGPAPSGPWRPTPRP